MRQSVVRGFLMATIAAGLLTGLVVMLLSAPTGGALAQTLPPRPPTAVPTTTPKHSKKEPAATGRIAGTVIEQTTGAPAPNITVDVGGVAVQTDANGNYERQGLAPGNYDVALVLSSEQGLPVQGTITIVLAEGQTVIQHLVFRHTEAPATTAPAVPAAPAVVPAQLPRTGSADGSGVLLALGVSGLLILGMGIALFRRAHARR